MTNGNVLTILHCIRAPVGGAFRHVLDLALAQSAAGHRVGILCDALTGGTYAADQIARVAPQLALGVIRTPMQRQISPRDLLVTAGLCRRVARLRPDILHGHGAKGGAFARLLGSLLRVVGQHPARIYSPHGGSLHIDATTVKGRLVFAIERLLERFGDGIIFVSAFEAAAYAAKVGTPRGVQRLIHNGLNPEEFVAVAPADDAVDLLYIGELRDLKGVDVLLEAVGQLTRAGRAVRLLVVGAGERADTYRASVDALHLADRVSFAPPMPIRSALSRARAVVLPSRAESLPYVVLETVAAGVPILATRVGGIAEVFGPAASRLLPAGDAVALAAAIAALLDDPEGARRDADALRTAISGQFSAATMVGAVETLYRDILHRPRTAATTPALGQGEASTR